MRKEKEESAEAPPEEEQPAEEPEVKQPEETPVENPEEENPNIDKYEVQEPASDEEMKARAEEEERLRMEEEARAIRAAELRAKKEGELQARREAEMQARLEQNSSSDEPIADEDYNSTGDKRPDASHSKTHANVPGPKFAAPVFTEESGMAVFIKSKLRDGGICGLAQAFAEVTVDKGGNVVEYRVFKTSTDSVKQLMPDILTGLKFKPETVSIARQNVYIEFKADIVCEARKDKGTDLNEVPDYLIKP